MGILETVLDGVKKKNIENTGWLGKEVRVFVEGICVESEHDKKHDIFKD